MKPKKIIRIVVWCVVAFGAVTAVVVWRKATQKPEWWDASLPVAPTVPAADVGADIEMAVTTEMTQERPAQNSWTIDITEQQASAWLTGRLPDWLLNRSADVPAEWSRTAIRFTQDEFHIVAEVTPQNGGTRYVGVVLQPWIDENYALRIQANAATLGRLRTPFNVIADRLRPKLARITADTGADGSNSRAVQDFFETQSLTVSPADFELDDGRKVRIVGVSITPGNLRLTCTTLRATAPRRGERGFGKPR
jgi:hypothetical protein